MKHSPSKSGVQGEGDYASAEKYNKETEAYAKSGKAEQAAKDAAPSNAKEADEMRQAEAEGRSHAKGAKDGKHAEKDGDPAPGRKPEKKAPGNDPLSKNVPEKMPGSGR